jgi:hypothetical protein
MTLCTNPIRAAHSTKSVSKITPNEPKKNEDTTACSQADLSKARPNITIPKAKQTVIGLYVTAKEAYQTWRAAPETVMILDVRTPDPCALRPFHARAREAPCVLSGLNP